MTKLALLIGINYEGTSSELRGCINDVLATKKMIVEKLGYNEVKLMTDHTEILPTKHNIMKALIHLTDRSWDEDVTQIWVSYTGHGTYIKNANKTDEDDKRDECLCPLDFQENGFILDDTMNHVLSLMCPNISLTCMVDACHSETILDMRYRYIAGRKKNIVENPTCKITCNAIMISGCKDTQTSEESQLPSSEFAGAKTQALLKILEKYNYTIHCHVLISEMRKELRQTKFDQVPQMSSTRKIGPGTMFCISPTLFAYNM